MYDGWFLVTFEAAALWIHIQADLERLVSISQRVRCVLFLTRSFMILDLLGSKDSGYEEILLVGLLRCSS